MNKPSLETLIQRAKTTINTKLRVSNPAIDAVAAAIGGVTYGFYGYSDYLFRQLNPETADEEWLYIWSGRFEVTRIPAQFALGTVSFVGATPGSIVPKGLILKDKSDREYEVTEETALHTEVQVKSLIPGDDQNQSLGSELKMANAVEGLDPDSIIVTEITGGTNIEDLEKWRKRVVLAWNQTQVVGKTEDYKIWALASHPEIGFAWALDNTPEIGLVTVYIGKLDKDPTLSQEVKSTAEIYINANRPAGTHAIIAAPRFLPLSIQLSGVDNVETRTQIQIAVEAFIISKMETQSKISPGDIIVAITPITTDFSLIYPTETVTPDQDQVITPGDLIWT